MHSYTIFWIQASCSHSTLHHFLVLLRVKRWEVACAKVLQLSWPILSFSICFFQCSYQCLIDCFGRIIFSSALSQVLHEGGKLTCTLQDISNGAQRVDKSNVSRQRMTLLVIFSPILDISAMGFSRLLNEYWMWIKVVFLYVCGGILTTYIHVANIIKSRQYSCQLNWDIGHLSSLTHGKWWGLYWHDDKNQLCNVIPDEGS